MLGIPGKKIEKINILSHKPAVFMYVAGAYIFLLFLVPLLFLFLFSMYVPAVIGSLTFRLIIAAIAVYYLFLTLYTLTLWIKNHYDFLVVSDREIIQIRQQGLINRTFLSRQIFRVVRIATRTNGFLGSLFNFGDVILEFTGVDAPTLTITNIEEPITVADTILNVHNAIYEKEKIGQKIFAVEEVLKNPNIITKFTTIPPHIHRTSKREIIAKKERAKKEATKAGIPSYEDLIYRAVINPKAKIEKKGKK